MKAGFSLTKRYVPTFKENDKLNGAEQFVAVLKMPVTEDVFSILDRLQTAGLNGKTKISETDVSMDMSVTILKEAGQYIPKYVSFENAEDFTVDDVIKYPPYFSLAVELLFALVAFAQPTETDTKNS